MAAARPITSVPRRLGAGLFTAAAGITLAITPGVATAPDTAVAAAAEQASPSAAAQQAVETAQQQVGKPYEYGAAGPDSFDCSGLTQYSYRSAGVEIPRTSREQSEIGTPVDRANLIPGDLVFYYEPVSHVGIYIGDGQIVHAGNESTGVEVTSVDMEGYNTARRIA